MTTITVLPTPPTRDDPINFAARADIFLPALVPFCEEANALASEVNQMRSDAQGFANDADDSAQSAANAAISAQTAANAATTAASYVGEYESLTGSLNIPATTLYENRLWMLTHNVADVTTEIPGVSDAWYLQGTYETPIVVDTDTDVLAFNYYRITDECEITLPPSPTSGQWVGLISRAGFTVLRNGKKIEDQTEDLNANVMYKTFRMLFDSFSDSWYVLV